MSAQGLHAQALIGAVNALRTTVASLENAPNPDVAYKTVIEAQKQSFNLVESLTTAFGTGDGRLQATENAVNQFGQ